MRIFDHFVTVAGVIEINDFSKSGNALNLIFLLDSDTLSSAQKN